MYLNAPKLNTGLLDLYGSHGEVCVHHPYYVVFHRDFFPSVLFPYFPWMCHPYCQTLQTKLFYTDDLLFSTPVIKNDLRVETDSLLVF